MNLHTYLGTIGLPGMSLLIFFENIGVPLPTEAAYIVAQTLITTHQASYLTVLVLLQASHFFGSWTSYELGVRLRHSQRVREIEPKMGAVQATLNGWLTRYGMLAVFLSRLIGYVRPWASYLAGAAEVPRRSFLVWSFAGSLVFNITALSFTRSIVHLWQRYPGTRLGLSIFFTLSIIALVAWEVSHRTKSKPLDDGSEQK